MDIEAQLKYIPDTIVSGGAKGADSYAREFAKKHNLHLIEFFSEYEVKARKRDAKHKDRIRLLAR